MTAGKSVSLNVYPNNANTNGVALEPNSPKATKNEKRINEKRIEVTEKGLVGWDNEARGTE